MFTATLLIVTAALGLVAGLFVGWLWQRRQRASSKQEAVPHGQEYLHLVIDHVPNAIYAKDADHVFHLANQAMADLLHVPQDAIIGRKDSEFSIHPEELQAMHAHDTEVLKTGERMEAEEAYTSPVTGQTRWYQSVKVPFSVPDGPRLVLSISSDITTMKHTEQALLHRMETGRFVSRLATDFLNCSADEIDARLRVALSQTATLAGADRTYLGLFDDQRTQAFIIHEWTKEGVASILEKTQSLSPEHFPWVAQSLLRNEILCVDDIEEAPPEAAREKAFWRSIGTRAIAVLPMTFLGEVRGLWGFSTTQGPKNWEEEDLDAFRIVCELFATALDRKRREEDLRQNQERLALAIETSEAGVYEQDYPIPKTIYLSERATEITGYTAESIRPLLPASGLWFLPLVHPDDRRRAIRRDHEFFQGRSNRFRIECRIRHAQGHWRHAGIWARPVKCDAHNRPVSVVGVLFDIGERKAIEEELKRVATTDALTGARNRRFFMSIADEELRRARRYNRPLALLMMDIDHFKNVNDTYGHPAGDETLRAVTRACISILRENDRFGRLGGEEFAAILPETNAEAALEVAERLRVRLAGLEVAIPGHPDQSLSITVSIGITNWLAEDTDVEPLLQRADKALYAAKAAGRNRIVQS